MWPILPTNFEFYEGAMFTKLGVYDQLEEGSFTLVTRNILMFQGFFNRSRTFQLSMPSCHITYLFEAAIGAIGLKRTRPASLGVEGGAEADVVSGCGADERRVGEAWQHVEGGGQHCGVGGYPQRTLCRHLLVDLLPSRDLVTQPLRHKVLRP